MKAAQQTCAYILMMYQQKTVSLQAQNKTLFASGQVCCFHLADIERKHPGME